MVLSAPVLSFSFTLWFAGHHPTGPQQGLQSQLQYRSSCAHTPAQGSLSFRGEAPFLSLASKALHAQLSSSSGLITIGLQPPLIPGPKDLKVTMPEAPLPSPSSEYALLRHHLVDS